MSLHVQTSFKDPSPLSPVRKLHLGTWPPASIRAAQVDTVKSPKHSKNHGSRAECTPPSPSKRTYLVPPSEIRVVAWPAFSRMGSKRSNRCLLIVQQNAPGAVLGIL